MFFQDVLSTNVVRDLTLSLIVLFPVYLLGTAFYNLYLHPLKNYPGPRLAAATWSYKHYHMLKGDDPLWVHRQHQKYGNIVRVAPDSLSFSDPQAWRDIYGHKGGSKQANRKDLTGYPHRFPGHPPLISAGDDAVHGRQRRIFSNAFSDTALRKQEPMFRSYVDQLIAKLGAQIAAAPSTEFDMVKYFNFTTFDIMADLTFNEPLGMLDKSDYVPWVKLIFTAIKAATFFFVANSYPPLGIMLRTLVPSSMKQELEEHNKLCDERVDRRLDRDSDRPDIWSLVLAQEGDRALSRYEMYENAQLFMVAGTETTATLLSGLLYYLLEAPRAMDKLRAELDSTFASAKDVTGDALQRLPYLSACIEEGLRVYPPLPSGTTRLTPSEGAAICGEYLPGNTKITVTQYAAYHSNLNFALPDDFHPERFLSDNKDERFANDRKAALQPFSYGPRNCLGRNMAYFEMRLIIAELLMAYDIDLCEESRNWHQQSIYALWQKKPLLVTLKPRTRV